MTKDRKRQIAWIVLVVISAAACYFGYRAIRKIERQGHELADVVRVNHKLASETKTLAKSLQAGLIDTCKVNGNPLRLAEREDLEEGITSPHDPRLRELLPNIPPQIAERIVREGNRKKRTRLEKIQPVNCVAQYTEPPGP